jgi:hypothetical protein
VLYEGFGFIDFRDYGVAIFNGSVTIGQTSLVGVGYPRSDSVVPVMLRTVCCAITGILTFYLVAEPRCSLGTPKD